MRLIVYCSINNHTDTTIPRTDADAREENFV